MWRGFDVLDNRAAIQPSITVDCNSGFTVNVWSSWGISTRNVTNDMDELDFTITYGRDIGGIYHMEFGIINYNFPGLPGFPNNNSYSIEFFTSIAASIPIFDPYISIYYNTNLGDGLYVQSGFSRSLHLTPAVKPELSVDIGYNDGTWGLTKSGFSHADIGLALPFSAGKIDLKTGLFAVILLSNELKALNRDKTIELWGILGLRRR